MLPYMYACTYAAQFKSNIWRLELGITFPIASHTFETCSTEAPVKQTTRTASMASRHDEEFCSRCSKLVTYDGLLKLKSGERFELGPVRDVLSNTKCRFCLALKSCIGENLAQDEDVHGGPVNVCLVPEEYGVRICTGSQRLGSRSLVTSDTFILVADEVRKPNKSSSAPLTDVSSETVFSMARSWLRTCEETHKNCRRDITVPLLPSRVIDVNPGVVGVAARILETVKGQRARYLCLSYCWGGPQKIMATRASIQSLTQEIPVQDLGLTIQDAIETTRRLGFRYLWVDALCVVQDDDRDKLTEIPEMGSIFHNATATISAAISSSSYSGFLRVSRDASMKQHLGGHDFQITLPNNTTTTVSLFFFDHTNFSRGPTYPLSARAWALQEDVLSQRKLVFSNYELLVECHGECGSSRWQPWPLRESFIKYTDPSSYSQFWMLVDKERMGDGIKYLAPASTATSLIIAYSRRLLTDPEDRLHAFQGIADMVGARIGETVRFGIFLSLPVTLAWWTLHPAKVRSSRAPTWSWASLDCGVSCFSPVDSDLSIKASMRLDDHGSDGRKLLVNGRVIEGADWDSNRHPDDAYDYIRKPPVIREGRGISLDIEGELPNPRDRTYLCLFRFKIWDCVLVLERIGPGLYRRTGLYEGNAFVGAWSEKPHVLRTNGRPVQGDFVQELEACLESMNNALMEAAFEAGDICLRWDVHMRGMETLLWKHYFPNSKFPLMMSQIEHDGPFSTEYHNYRKDQIAQGRIQPPMSLFGNSDKCCSVGFQEIAADLLQKRKIHQKSDA
ncbi:heterokaryon incompatibility protein-domain-containing protein [Bombardia bombarda]|uniref:Heterokaryon incompatibility protein-domain-containing protein n=1 Tax=Bombardia bombarda TaxID=252184 RepID=A0AA39TMH2_9PEZI|nr:heterokaryon incompatibility protein-domain-containing protein [Bombardia bombarda]